MTSLTRAGAIAIAFVLAAGFRFLGLRNGFPNDHFVHLVGAQQLLLGDWPTRDFVDPGLPIRLIDELSRWLEDEGFASLDQIVGIANEGFRLGERHVLTGWEATGA